MLDLIIIGGSAAGLTASIYAARRKVNFKLITDAMGGEMASAGTVGNWPGVEAISGFELAQKMISHAKKNEVLIEEGWRAVNLIKEKNHLVVNFKNAKGEEKTEESKAVIIATGIHPRKLGIPGEKEFEHKGVTYCTVCDGPLFKNKITATVGTGNGALQGVIMMSKIAKKVYLLSKYPNTEEKKGGFPRAENVLIDTVKSLPNVEIIYDMQAKEIIGDKMVTGLKYATQDGENTIETQAVMVHVGNIPNSDFVVCVNKDVKGQIMVDTTTATSCPGIFAAGDVTDSPYKQLVIAAGQGSTAALSAIDYITKWSE